MLGAPPIRERIVIRTAPVIGKQHAEHRARAGHPPGAGGRHPPPARVLGTGTPAAGAAGRREDRRRHPSLRRPDSPGARQAGTVPERRDQAGGRRGRRPGASRAQAGARSRPRRRRSGQRGRRRARPADAGLRPGGPAGHQPRGRGGPVRGHRAQRAGGHVLRARVARRGVPGRGGDHPPGRGQLHLPRDLEAVAGQAAGRPSGRCRRRATTRARAARPPIRWPPTPST